MMLLDFLYGATFSTISFILLYDIDHRLLLLDTITKLRDDDIIL